MALHTSLGIRLVENFKLLLEYMPNEDCSLCVNEQMLLKPDKRIFHTIMSFILGFIDPNWQASLPSVVVTKGDERLFYNGLSGYLKTLRKEFPEVGLPLLSPSSLICFHGDKCREILLKVTNALMLKIMKEDEFDIDNEAVESNFNEFENLCRDNCKLRSDLESIEQKNAEAQRLHVLKLIIDAGNWNDNLKTRLMNYQDNSVISDIQNENARLIKEINTLKDNLQPYLKHIHHQMNKKVCECGVSFPLSFSDINKSLQELNMKSTEDLIKNINCVSAMKYVGLEESANKPKDMNLINEETLKLIAKLENNFHAFGKDKQMTNLVIFDSPISLNTSASFGGTTRFSPAVVPDGWNLKEKSTLEVNLESFNDLIKPLEVNLSPVDPIDYVISRTTTRKVCDESVSSILQRMRSHETPRKFKLVPKTSKSASKDYRRKEKFTPLSRSKIDTSQSTNRRQSDGFLKPSHSYVRKKLNTFSGPGENISKHPVLKEIVSNEQYASYEQDSLVIQKTKEIGSGYNNGMSSCDTLDAFSSTQFRNINECNATSKDSSLGKQILECDRVTKDLSCISVEAYCEEMLDDIIEKEQEISFCGDFSISGVESLPSSPSTEMNLISSGNSTMSPEVYTNLTLQKTTDLSIVMFEMEEEGREINNALKGAIKRDVSSELCSFDTSEKTESVLDAPNIAGPEVNKKSLSQRKSLLLLIEKFNALKSKCDNK